ncbi:serine protease inhibitor [Lentinula raphanica]|nr:serine protease inhibitor [Lentinula raphanica]KAJ3969933.1 serine protease inhibitor [Lentinula raphanica]
MALETGLYIIKNADKIVGRALAEDLSLLPRRIILAESDNKFIWVIEKLDNDTYKFISEGSPTTHFDHKVFGLLLEHDKATKWHVIPVSQHGDNAYLIADTDLKGGWVAPEHVGEQIIFRPLIVQPSEPPRYPGNQVFNIIKVDE